MSDDSRPLEEAMGRASLRLTSSSPEATFEIGRRLGTFVTSGATIALVGELGAGKTTFTRGLVCGAGCPEYRRVNSPTYVLEQVYEGACRIHHFDAYRLGQEEELVALGFEERMGQQALLVVEWADRVRSVLPDDHLEVEIEHQDADCGGLDSRVVTLRGVPSRWDDTLGQLRD